MLDNWSSSPRTMAVSFFPSQHLRLCFTTWCRGCSPIPTFPIWASKCCHHLPSKVDLKDFPLFVLKSFHLSIFWLVHSLVENSSLRSSFLESLVSQWRWDYTWKLRLEELELGIPRHQVVEHKRMCCDGKKLIAMVRGDEVQLSSNTEYYEFDIF